MIELQSVKISVGDFQLPDLSFRVEAGQYAVLMGRTGLGKTTILEAICGLRAVAAGTALLDNIDVTNWSPADRNTGYVPQDLALFPTMTVEQHLTFALRLHRIPPAKRRARAGELAELLSIERLLARDVRELSGGEAQRVALGRALSHQPRVLLLDEPLSALDAATRASLRTLLKDLNQETGVTVLHVTHDPDEARTLADVMLQLAIDESTGTPRITVEAG